jgi:malate dehydrogenase (oxaloacetate-decarboxylating)
MSLKEDALAIHKLHRGKLSTELTLPLNDSHDLSLAYTPGVAEVCKEIAEHPETVDDYTIKGHTVAIVTDGSAVLGLGDIGPEASMPVMEGKAVLFKHFGGIDAFPICLNERDVDEIIKIVKALAPTFGGINLEDIGAPRCFAIEDALQDIGIPVMHDDQHGTAVVVLAGLINAAKVVGKRMEDLKVVISGAGAAGSAIAQLLAPKVADILMVDSKGIIYQGRGNLDEYKEKWAAITNKEKKSGGLQDALAGADVFIGVSKANLLTAEDIKRMADKSIIFAMANPVPEIMPEEAKAGGAFVVASGRSDYPNQVNNVLSFPGLFKGALESKASKITDEMKVAAAEALAGLVKNPTPEEIIPGPFDPGVVEAVANAVKKVSGI